MRSGSFDDESRRAWHNCCQNQPTDDQLKIGCLQRIADATEAMAVNHKKLIDENAWLSQSRKEYAAKCARLARSNAALRGVIKRMKRLASHE